MASLFLPTRSLLYPQFETYRLHSLDPTNDSSSYPLPGSGATQSRVGYNTHLLSFKETRARISWNHLTTFEDRGMYVDVEWNIIGFTLDDDVKPHFSTLASLPVPISSSQTAQHPEYPSILALSATKWIVSSGTGSLYLLETSSSGSFTGNLIARYDLVLDSQRITPFVLHAGRAIQSSAKVLISRSVRQTEEKRKSASSATTFELLEVSLDLERNNAIDQAPEELSVEWKLRGGDSPYSCCWNGHGWIVLANEAFKVEEEEPEDTEEERMKRERQAKIEKLGLGANLPEEEKEEDQTERGNERPASNDEPVETADDKQWPYSWTQTFDSVSVVIPVPSSTSRQDLSIDLTSTSFTMSLSNDSSPDLAAFLSKGSRQFWTTIDPSTSTWTFDSTKNQIELDLAKVDINTRWPSVFFPTEDEDEDDEVPETISKAMLDAVKASFSNIHTRQEGEPAGNHPAIPALLREEMEYDLEDGEDFGENETGVFGEAGGGGRVGRDVFVGYIKNGQPSFSRAQTTVVSLPLGGSEQDSSVMVKSAVDGLLFDPSVDPFKEPWEHVSTSPALAFVLSSKRDLRLVRHLPISSLTHDEHDDKKAKKIKGTTVLAFDAGGSGTASGNLYVYYPPISTTTAKQGVVRVSGGDRGALLGVGELVVNGERIVVALCEKALVVLHGVLQ